MKYQKMKVFDIRGAEEDIFEISHKLSSECHNNGNDSYYQFEVVENPTGEEEGNGYLSDSEVEKLTQWLSDNGAVIGESVLISHWW